MKKKLSNFYFINIDKLYIIKLYNQKIKIYFLENELYHLIKCRVCPQYTYFYKHVVCCPAILYVMTD